MSYSKLKISLLLAVVFLFFTGCSDITTSMHQAGNFVKASTLNKKADSAYNNYDYQRAFNTYQAAAKLGNKDSQYHLAQMYAAGEGVKQDMQKYFYWMQQSAHNGHPSANYLVGNAYLHKFPSVAAKYFKIAADKEHGTSMYMLGWMYATGKGVQQNNREALAWFKRAKAQAFPVEQQLLSTATLQKYVQSKSRTIQRKKSTQRELVRNIQQELTRLGYNPGPIDGLFGRKTKKAIMTFQRSQGIQPDGRATQNILQKLNKAK